MKIPQYVSKPGRAWLKKVSALFNFGKAEEDLLLIAATCLDRLDEIRQAVEKDGLTVLDRFDQSKAHPLLSVERDNRLTFSRICNQLRIIDDGSVKDA